MHGEDKIRQAKTGRARQDKIRIETETNTETDASARTEARKRTRNEDTHKTKSRRDEKKPLAKSQRASSTSLLSSITKTTRNQRDKSKKG